MQNLIKYRQLRGRLDSVNSLVTDLDELRGEFQSANKEILLATDIKLGINDLKELPEGRFSIIYNNVEFESLYKINSSERNRLYVVFSGSRQPGRKEPTFNRWSYYKMMKGDMLNIDDPMCKIYKNCELGWYYGTENECYLDYLYEIIKKVADENNYKDVVFFASSGGGFAALYCTCKFKGSTAVVINPQIRPELYRFSKNFVKITHIDFSKADKFNRNRLPEMIKNSSESRFIFVENCASPDDMIQLNDLCKTLEVNEYHYGLNSFAPHIACWIYEANSESHHTPHADQEFNVLFYAMEYLVNNFKDIAVYNDLYLIISEIWNKYFIQLNEIRNMKTLFNRKTYILNNISYNSDNCDKSKFEMVIRNIDFEKKESDYNFICVYDRFLPNSLYRFSFSEISLVEGKSDAVSVLMKDTKYEQVDFKKDFNFNEPGEIVFFIGDDATEKSLRIYAGQAGKTKNNHIFISSCKLEKL